MFPAVLELRTEQGKWGMIVVRPDKRPSRDHHPWTYNKPAYDMHVYQHGNTLLLSSLHSSDSSLCSRHREMRAPCDSPVRSHRTDLCGISQLSAAPLMRVLRTCMWAGSAAHNGGWCGSSGRCWEKSPCVSKLWWGRVPDSYLSHTYFPVIERRKTNLLQSHFSWFNKNKKSLVRGDMRLSHFVCNQALWIVMQRS